jgi:hypothetical protein
MKRFLCKLLCVMQEFGYARAATELTRNGKYKEAQAIMKGDRKCEC